MNNDPLSTSKISVEEARKTLGKVAEGMSDEQLQEQLAKMKYLIEGWLDQYERSIFDGKTLRN
ncbi:MAG TPA: hypothetical protein VKC54_00755 [Patescibacteria group bacterium]|nr:hypothetical protein [Patescibacteria group bacterium]